MTLFSTITKGMADGAETLQANFAKLAKAITSIGDDGTMTVPKLSVDNLEVDGTGIFEHQTATVSFQGNNSALNLIKVGNLVIVNIYYGAASASTSTITISLPTGFNASSYMQVQTSLVDNTGNGTARVAVSGNNLMIFPKAVSGSMYGSVVYFVP